MVVSGKTLGSLTAYTMFLRYNVPSQQMPVFCRALVRPRVMGQRVLCSFDGIVKF